MRAAVERRLPGIRFETVAPLPTQGLPRMDVAAFVGFAASGPLHTPVPIDDEARFRDVFGEALPLAWDARRGRRVHACLAPAVEAFFRNGGRRCWVVRVAARPTTNRFILPGLVDAATGRPAYAPARSGGSWSDALRAGTVLVGAPFGVLGLGLDGPPTRRTFRLHLQARPGELRAGDLLRLRAGDRMLFVTAARVASAAAGLRVDAVDPRWFSTANPALATFRPAAARLLTPDGETPLGPCQVRQAEGYDVALPGPRTPAPGDVLRLRVAPEHGYRGGRMLWLTVTSVATVPEGDLPGGSRVLVRAGEGTWPFVPKPATERRWIEAFDPSAVTVERLSFELLVWNGQELRGRLGDLGFAALPRPDEATPEETSASRFWAELPDDDTLFRLVNDQPVVPPAGTLAASASEPRFALAGAPGASRRYLPLGMPVQPAPEAARGRLATPEAPTTLARDGLADFRAALFLDADLADQPVRTLLDAARDKRYVQRRPLSGLHSLFPVEEPTLVAVPDAVHRGWMLARPAPPRLLAAPDGFAIRPAEDPGAFVASWIPVPGQGGNQAPAPTYELQQSAAPDFSLAATTPAERPSARVYLDAGCPRRTYFRVRAVLGSQVSPWSATLSLVEPPLDFEAPSEARQAIPPRLRAEAGTAGSMLRWTHPGGVTAFTLETAADPAFLTARPLFEGGEAERSAEAEGDAFVYTYPLSTRPEGLHYFRVRAAYDERPGPWSNTVVGRGRAKATWQVLPPEQYEEGPEARRDELLAVHHALLRFCHARGDLLAVLALPEHAEARQVLAHVAALTPDPSDDTDALPFALTALEVPRLGAGEAHALSYGALYHPWIALQAAEGRGDAVTYFPPDGAVLGLLARQTLAAGAWIAPANRPLAGALALTPPIDRAAWARLAAQQVNLVRPDPRGFVPFGADTLSADEALRPLTVRRLLILLRRLALREGSRYAFDTHDDALRRRLFFHFTRVLDDLYARGALAGASADEAYRVVTDETVNPPGSVERGQVVVELHVAPSRPLSFVTVRLLQRDVEGFTIEER